MLYLNFQNKSDFQFLAELFTGNPDETTIPQILKASPEFKNRLHLLDALGKQFYQPKLFFDSIATNQSFLCLRGHIANEFKIYQYTKKIAVINGLSTQSSDVDRFVSFLDNHYSMSSFRGNSRKKIGVSDKAQRECRFCGRSMSMSNVKFSNKSHAISESLGNKNLICLEECDDCNQHFNETIEQDISKFFRFQLFLNGIHGKRGIPSLKGKEISAHNSIAEGKETLVFNVEKLPFTRDMKIVSQYISQQLSSTSDKYIPQNIYKCFCKYVLSLIDSRYLTYFQETIKWIKEPLAKRNLPPIWYNNVPVEATPIMAIMTRKHNHKDIPYCWAIMNVAGLRFFFIVPFCSQDKYKFVGKNRMNYFLDGLKYIMPNVELHQLSLSGIEPVNQQIDFKIEIPPNCVEGRDYYIINNQ